MIGRQNSDAPQHAPRKLSEWIPKHTFVGTSLILPRQGRLLYGIRAPRTEGKQQVAELTGIGGALEADDRSVTAGVQREALEEVGCTAWIIPCAETLVVRGPELIERVALEGRERPCAVVFRRYRTPPHQPWHERNQGEACLVIFLADLCENAWPTMELPALIWLSPEQVVETARVDVPLRRLVHSGAALIEKAPGVMPLTAWARLTDSQEALALALGNGAVRFYAGLQETAERFRAAQSAG